MMPNPLSNLEMEQGIINKKLSLLIWFRWLMCKSIMATSQARLKFSKWNAINAYMIMAHIFRSLLFSLTISSILIDKGGQCPILMQQDAENLRVWPGRQRVKITQVNWGSVTCQLLRLAFVPWMTSRSWPFTLQLKITIKTIWVSIFWKIKPGVWLVSGNIYPVPKRSQTAMTFLCVAPACPEYRRNVPACHYQLLLVFPLGTDEALSRLQTIKRDLRTLGSGAQAVLSSVLIVTGNDGTRNRKIMQNNTWLWDWCY